MATIMVTHQRLKAPKRGRSSAPNNDDMMLGRGMGDSEKPTARTRRNTVAAAAALGLAASVILLSDATGTSPGGGGIGLRRALQVIESSVVANATSSAPIPIEDLIFDAEFLPNPNPTTLDCERHFLDGHWQTVEDVPQPVPTGSKFQLNNDFTTKVLSLIHI